MFLNAALLGIASAIDPTSFATIAYFLSRENPSRLLRAYLIGGMGLSIGLGLAALFALQGIGAGGQREFHPVLDLTIGTFALLVALLVGSGYSRRISAWFRARRGAERSTATRDDNLGPDLDLGPDASGSSSIPGIDKLPQRVRDALENGSPWVAWALGIGFGMPGAYYLAAVTMIIRSHTDAVAEIAAILVFNALMFVAVIVPLVSYRRDPVTTQARVDALRNWVTAHSRLVIAAVATLAGLYLVARGISKL